MITTVEFEVYGDRALFSTPETASGGDKLTYQIPTYEAIKGVLHSIYFKPTLTWIIDKVRVMNPIRTETHGMRLLKYLSGKSDLVYYTYLSKCRYQVQAHFIWNENHPELEADRNMVKHLNIAKRMIERGGRRDIFLGTRECQSYVAPCVFGEGEGFYDNSGKLSFGMMYHGITYADECYSKETKNKMNVRLWNAVMDNGVIDFPEPKDCIHKYIRDMQPKVFDARKFVDDVEEVI